MSGLGIRRLTCLCLLPCLALVAQATPARAQDAPSAPTGPAEPDSPPAAPVEPAPTPAPAPEVPPAAAPAEPVGPAVTTAPAAPPAATGNAAFAPLPDAPREHSKPRPKQRTAPVAPEPLAAASEAPLPPPTTPDAVQPSATPAQATNDSDSGKNDTDGLFGPFRLGVLAGGGLPEVLSLGAQIKLTRFFGAGVNVGLIPTVKIAYYGQATLAYQEYDAYAHIYPFGGSFFIGAGAGYATIRGTVATQYSLASYQAACPVPMACSGIPSSIDVNSEATVRTLVLTPQIGFMHIFGSGFALGIDVGAQVPIAPSKVDFSTVATKLPPALQSVVQTQYINPNDEKVRTTLDKIGRTPLPTFGLKIGWFL